MSASSSVEVSRRPSFNSTADIGLGYDTNLKFHVPAPPPLNGIRQDIQRRLDMLDVKEEEIRRQRLELKSAWNHSLAVTQLPNEILFHIFVAVGRQPVPPSIRIPIKFGQAYGDSDGDKDDGSELTGLAKTGWTKLMLVCRRWHDVACETPALWRTIDVGKTTNWMKLALAQSGSATLDVSFPFRFSEEHASLLKPHCHRLRSLRLRSWSPFALRLVRNALPALETLEIPNNPGGMKDAWKGFYTDLRLSQRQLPNLRTLQLAYSLIPRDPLFYARLRKLSLRACPFKATVEQFVQLLAVIPCLEHLELDEFLQHLSDSGEVGPAWPLPCLRSLRLSNHIPLHSARFLSRLLIPQTLTAIAIEGLAEEEADNAYTLRALVPPNAASSLAGLSTVTWARLVVTWDEIAIEGRSVESEEEGEEEEEESDLTPLVDLALTASSPPEPGWADSMPDGLADLLALFGGAPLTRLELVGDCSAVSEDMWTTLFRTFPALVWLEAEADSVLFAGLHEASLATTGSSRSADELVACRGLKRIVLNDDWGVSRTPEDVLDPLIRCLRYRAERGIRLQELYVALPQSFHEVKGYLEPLEELVPDLVVIYAHAFAPSVGREEGEDDEGEEGDDENQDASDEDIDVDE